MGKGPLLITELYATANEIPFRLRVDSMDRRRKVFIHQFTNYGASASRAPAWRSGREALDAESDRGGQIQGDQRA